jgi:hypothetical protein
MEKCYEYLGCNQKDCIMYKRPGNERCWEIEGTLCNHPGMELIRKVRCGKKIDACVYCIYYQEAKNRGLV